MFHPIVHVIFRPFPVPPKIGTKMVNPQPLHRLQIAAIIGVLRSPEHGTFVVEPIPDLGCEDAVAEWRRRISNTFQEERIAIHRELRSLNLPNRFLAHSAPLKKLLQDSYVGSGER